jgi:hypothetical protein
MDPAATEAVACQSADHNPRDEARRHFSHLYNPEEFNCERAHYGAVAEAIHSISVSSRRAREKASSAGR